MTISVNVFLNEINNKKLLISKLLITVNNDTIKLIAPPCIITFNANMKKLTMTYENEKKEIMLSEDEMLALISAVYLAIKSNTRIDVDELIQMLYKITNNKKCFKILHTLLHENNIKLFL